jgi:GT2 family glycosyltransferase
MVSSSVTVLICTRDRPDLLERCLHSVLAASGGPEEILVVDQSRGNDSEQVVARLSAAAGAAHVQLRYLRDLGRGLSRAQNLGLQQAGGDVVLVTDDDCVVGADWVQVARDAFTASGELGLLGGRVLPLGEDEPGRLPVSTRTSQAPLVLDGGTAPWFAGSGNNFALRRSVALAVGGNDERLGPGAPLKGGGDMDLFRRVLRAGHAGRYEPGLVVLHERATPAERLGRRVPYGYGMGACISFWARQGDPRALRLLVGWLRLRGDRILEGARERDGLRLREELLILTGTARGLVAGLRGPAGPVSLLRQEPSSTGR